MTEADKYYLRVGDVVTFDCNQLRIKYKKWNVSSQRKNKQYVNNGIEKEWPCEVEFEMENFNKSKGKLAKHRKHQVFTVNIEFLSLRRHIAINFARMHRERHKTGHDCYDDDLDMLYTFPLIICNPEIRDKQHYKVSPNYHMRIVSIFVGSHNLNINIKTTTYNYINLNMFLNSHKLKFMVEDIYGYLHIFSSVYFRKLNDDEKVYSNHYFIKPTNQ
jgi:hypothetical protein